MAEATDAAKKLAADLEAAVSEVFPNSTVRGVVGKGTFLPSVDLWFTLYKKGEYANGIDDNDPAKMCITVFLDRKTGEVTDQMRVENSGGSMFVKPPEGSHLAYGRLKLGWINFKGDSDYVVKRVKKFFEKAKATIVANFDNVPDKDKKLVAEKVGLDLKESAPRMKHVKLFESFLNEEEKELYYVQDSTGSIKNISTSKDDADTFLAKSLKYNGDVFYVSVPKKDWDAEKVTPAYIKAFVKNNYK